MNAQEFAEVVELLKSKDAMTYEDGYFSLLGNVDRYLAELVALMQAEAEPSMRGKYIELLGDCSTKEVIPILEAELSSSHREVRFWAYSQLAHNDHPEAKEISRKYKEDNPNEDWY
ncbi:HEAT repeat domain-containing protein [Pleionea litopenaei]|uniref:HEAT repeat domain-containing protein n=1 Tax=Pleionea litopenaei TaxID=3070815 RepID=A0AA51RWD8_9GAMM|nr:HEAT repeat domain-containing protein [Pleionea sp. HL-JVS1]WMS88812.1 HEAT repeat domain-containing protein [Pleionea sp. HL-JVS1]